MGVYNQSAIKSLFNGKSKTTDAEKEDLMNLLESLPLSQRKELYRFVKKNDSMFTKDEVEIYKAGSTIRGIENLRILIKKKKRARQAGLKLSQLKKGAFEESDEEWERLQNGTQTVQKRTRKVRTTTKAKASSTCKRKSTKSSKKTA
jgi:hypothetical protein